MENKFRLLLLVLLLTCISPHLAFSQSTYTGLVTGRLIWNDPQGNTVPLENIRMQLLADGHGVIANTLTLQNGLFTFNVASFTDPDPTLELAVKIWAANDDRSILAGNTTIRKTVVMNSGQLVWPASLPVFPIGDVAAPDDSRAQCVHWANKAKVFVESELAGDFAFPTGNAFRLHIMEPPFSAQSNFFLPEGLVSTVIALLTGPVPNPAPLFVPAIAAAPAAFTNNPGIYILDETSNGTVYHEFAHYLMWNLQNRSWLSMFEAGLSFHSRLANDPSQKMAWTEGFANGFAQIMESLDRRFDNTNITSLDNTSTFDLLTNSMRDISGTVFPSAQVLDHGFAAEANIGDYIYDLWDGPNNLALFGNSTPPTFSYSDGGADQTEMSLAAILEPMLQKQAPLGPNVNVLNRFGQEDHLINNIVEYHDLLLPWVFCLDGSQINRLTRLNRIHNLSNTITDPLAETEFINSDDIYYNRIVSTRRFKFVGRPTFNFKELNPPNAVDYKLDVTALRDSDDDYNMQQDGPDNHAQIIADNIQISLDPSDPATLHINTHLNDRFQNSTNTWGEPGGVLPAQNKSHLPVLVECSTTIDVGDNGTLELGDEQEDNTAEVRFSEGSTLQLGGAAGSGRGPGKLIINDGSRVILNYGSNFIFNAGSEIILDGPDAVLEIDGNWIIEEGATFTFSGEGHIETRMEQPIVMGPNSNIVIDGLGKQEHLIWVANRTVELPTGLDKVNFSLMDGIVEIGDEDQFLIHDSKLTLEDLIVRPTVSSAIPLGFHCEGNINSVERVDFLGGNMGFEANMLGTFAQPLANLKDCKFIGCKTAFKTTGRGVSVQGTEFTNTLVGWQGVDVDDASGFLGCTFGNNGAGISVNRPGGPSPILIGFVNSSINDGTVGIQLDGAFDLTAQCLNINNATNAVLLKNSASATLNANNHCSFNTTGTTWVLDNGRLPNLAAGNNQYASGGLLFEGSVMPSPAVPAYNSNHWQAFDNRALLPVDQSLIDANLGTPIVRTGTGMSGFNICGAAPKSNASSRAQGLAAGLGEQVQLIAFPQPFQEQLSLELSGISSPALGQLLMRDLTGKVQYRQEINLKNGVLTVGAAQLPAGVYFLSLQADGYQTSIKVIKQ